MNPIVVPSAGLEKKIVLHILLAVWSRALDFVQAVVPLMSLPMHLVHAPSF